jgi:hypothetical protein
MWENEFMKMPNENSEKNHVLFEFIWVFSLENFSNEILVESL